jgi:hypothetical protein
VQTGVFLGTGLIPPYHGQTLTLDILGLWGFYLRIFFCMTRDFFSGFFLPFLRVMLFSQNLTSGTKFDNIVITF